MDDDNMRVSLAIDFACQAIKNGLKITWLVINITLHKRAICNVAKHAE